MSNFQQPAKDSPFKASCHFHSVSATIGDEDANARNVALQFKDALGNNIGALAHGQLYISDDAEGDDHTGTAPTSVAAGAAGLVLAVVANKVWDFVTGATGLLNVVITYTGGAKTYYLNVKLPDGRIQTIGPITFA